MPRLKVFNECKNILNVAVQLRKIKLSGQGSSPGYSAVVSLDLRRVGVVEDTGLRAWVSVWNLWGLFGGPPERAHSEVSEAVEELVTKLAADYYRAGNE